MKNFVACLLMLITSNVFANKEKQIRSPAAMQVNCNKQRSFPRANSLIASLNSIGTITDAKFNEYQKKIDSAPTCDDAVFEALQTITDCTVPARMTEFCK